jgi:hypothetical protein
MNAEKQSEKPYNGRSGLCFLSAPTHSFGLHPARVNRLGF